ncbi:RNA polymerase sigma-G factor [Anaerosporomusa subterranea]|uniref:RNA polymerase sigma factor n=1 Tax=Anaerosporomusa subterranea TaxID=1794912 RepID=A0A154BTZ0_ANASB|nr:SigF/SigG family RNA polymerase sporulation sigma factor [Anaerosporomusa subterranea]KYZ77494.1 RNA polymerase sigma-G factor [Anaerosporomusa subterranea]
MLGEKLQTLLERAHAGDQEAREAILEQNINLVRSIVHRFTGRGYEWDDLFQIGCIGLVKAIDRFDTAYGVKFSTYAVPMIIGEIRRFIRDDNPIKVSRSTKELALKIHRTQEKLQGSLGREPTVGEIAEGLLLPVQEVVAALEAVQPTTSIYAQSTRDNGDSILLLDHLRHSDDEGTFENLALREVISKLPPKEQAVIKLRFFEDKTQSEIAAVIGLSQVQVSRIEKNALRLMKELMKTS